jgi:hypothetical protein
MQKFRVRAKPFITNNINDEGYQPKASSQIEEMKRMYVENVMFRYITGMPDLATRNFVMKDQRVYSIDEDSIDKDFNLEAAFSKKGEFTIFVDELRKHKEHYKKVLFRYIQFMPAKKIQKELQLSERAGVRHLFLYNLLNQ